MDSRKSVVIIGAGPVGLAAAAHVLERGMRPVVLEAGPDVGHAIRQWGHVQLFSPWEYNIDKAAYRLLAQTGWKSPNAQDYPTGWELVESYLEPLANTTALSNTVLTSSKVTGVTRQGIDKLKSAGRATTPFEVRYERLTSPGVPEETTILAEAIIDASGTWSSPNPAGANGLYAIGEKVAVDRISYAMPDVLGADRARFAGKTVAVLGAGHSAIGTMTDLARLKAQVPETDIVWLLRGDDPAKAFGGGANDKLTARGALGEAFAGLIASGKIQVEAGFRTTHLAADGGRLRIGAGSARCGRAVVVDELVVATGFRPDLSFLRELRIQLDAAVECPIPLAPLIDPNIHSCGTVRPHGARELAQEEPGFYLAGIKSYGRAPTFLMMTGYEQVRSIAAELANDIDAARRVELVLPETGVCSRGVEGAAVSACGSLKKAPDACRAENTTARQDEQTVCSS